MFVRFVPTQALHKITTVHKGVPASQRLNTPAPLATGLHDGVCLDSILTAFLHVFLLKLGH